MKPSINLIFGCHSHQPVGNFEHVFAEAYRNAYLPFTEVLERFPDVRVTQHFTGPLLDWFEANQPDFLKRLAVLVERGQVEIMGGGYYEPLICAIPERDAIAQIGRMADFCKKHFGQKPAGMWLTERVWEPHMPHILSKAGIEYTALDDTHFLCSGLAPEDLFGYYLTEDEGHCVKVFPILKKLRYLIPFHQVFESIDYLREHVTEDGMRCAVIHDDGEKFGVWPGTNKSVYEEGWLERFFEALTENKEWLHSVTYSQYLAKSPAIGRTYLTAASYEEMMEWVLPTDVQRSLQRVLKSIDQDPSRAEERRFVRGGFWRGFLAKYPESNGLHKKMLRVSGKLEALREAGKRDARIAQAEQLLHQGQCNCAYWHGVFGGLYLNHLRTAIYERLAASECLLNAIFHKGAGWVDVEKGDFDADGHVDAVIENNRLALALRPMDGGTLYEWSYFPKPFNFANTLSRREEPYHDAVRMGRVHVGDALDGEHSIHELVRAKEAGLEKFLVYDPYLRVSLRDHFFGPEVAPEALWAGNWDERGDFVRGVYDLTLRKDAVIMRRTGNVWTGDRLCEVMVRKTVTLAPDASAFGIRYDIVNQTGEPADVVFGVEFAVNLLSGSSFDRYYRSDDRDLNYAKLGAMGTEADLSHLALRDDWQKLECGFRFNRAASVHHFCIETVSQSEAGQERVYQGSIVIPYWPLRLLPGKTATREISAEVVETT